jgi:hypothetical protein
MDEGRLHKIAVEEMCTERRMNGGGSKWLLGCWTEAHPRTSAYCRTILTMNQTGASTCAEGTKHISSTKRTNTKPAGLAWKKRSPHQGRKKRTPQQRARAPGAQKGARLYKPQELKYRPKAKTCDYRLVPQSIVVGSCKQRRQHFDRSWNTTSNRNTQTGMIFRQYTEPII